MTRLAPLCLLIASCYTPRPVPERVALARDLVCEHQFEPGPTDPPFRATWTDADGVKRWRWGQPGEECTTETLERYILEAE